MHYILLLTIIGSSIIFVVSIVDIMTTRRITKKRNEFEVFYRQWECAHINRLEWWHINAHLLPDAFNHPDYQELFEVELGIEALLTIRFPDYMLPKSYSDYQHEKMIHNRRQF